MENTNMNVSALTRNFIAGLAIYIFGSVLIGNGLPLKNEIVLYASQGMHLAGATISNAIIESKPTQ